MKQIKHRFSYLISYSVKDNINRKCYYLICFISCFIVGLISLASRTVLHQTPLIFLTIAESNEGEIDIEINTYQNYGTYQLSNNTEVKINYNSFLNFSEFERIQNESKYLKSMRSTQRIILYGSVTIRKQSSYSIVVRAIDTNLEREIELGKSYKIRKLIENECVIQEKFANKFGIQVNDQIDLTLDLKEHILFLLLSDKDYRKNDSKIIEIDNLDVEFKCKVISVLGSLNGKAANWNHNTIFMESDQIFKVLAKNLPSKLLESYPDFREKFIEITDKRLKEMGNQIILSFPQPRTDTYLESNYNELLKKTTSVLNEISLQIGNDHSVRFDMPLVSEMKKLEMGSMFLGLILNVITIILFSLSVILIYSLLLISIESKSVEYGIIKLIGLNRTGIIFIVIFQCLSFSIPSFLLACIIQNPFNAYIARTISSISGTAIEINASYQDFLYSFILTNLSPLIASIFPIVRLFRKNIADSIDSKTLGVKIEITSSLNNQRNTLLIFGSITLGYGLGIYYFLPLSLLSMNIALLLLIFIWILVGMLLGLSIISLNLENFFQKLTTYIFFFWADSYIIDLVLKNLVSHRIRNRKTSIMYSLSVGFFIMISVGYNLEMNSINNQELNKQGSYFNIYTIDNLWMSPQKMSDSLNLMKKYGLIEGFSFQFSIDTISSVSCEFLNYGKSFNFNTDLNSISPNFKNVTIDYMIKTIFGFDVDDNFIEKLYSKQSEGKIGVSALYNYKIGIDLEEKFLLKFNFDKKSLLITSQADFILDNLPGFNMQQSSLIMKDRSTIIPIHQFIDIFNKILNLKKNTDNYDYPTSFPYYKLPFEAIFLKLPENVQKYQLDMISDIINQDPQYLVSYSNYFKSLNPLNSQKEMINFIFSAVNGVIMVFCFFNLYASMHINILEQHKEISLLRSIGIKKRVIIFIYIFEGFVLVFSSSFVGVLIGTLISTTMTLQRTLFTSIPLQFVFPQDQIIQIIAISIVGGFISCYFPMRKLVNKQISEIGRG